MSNSTMENVLKETQDFIMKKEASFGKAAKEEALDNPSAVPGSNHDKDVPDEFQKADPEVQQELPPGTANDASGATEAEKLESGHATDALQPHGNVTQKPMISNDANAKEASGVQKHATDLTNLINNYKAQQAEKAAGAEEKKAEDATAPAEEPEKKAEEEPPATGSDAPAATEPEKKAEEKAAEEKAAECEKCGKADCGCDYSSKKAAPADEIELTQEVLAKIACTVLSTEEGANFVEQVLQKEAGAQAARDTMEFLHKQAEEAEKSAAYTAGQDDADFLIQEHIKLAAEDREKAAYEAGRQSVLQNQPVDYTTLGQQVATDAVKRAQAEAMGMDPAALAAEAPAEGDLAGADVAMEGMAGGGSEEPSEDEIMQALEMLVASGQLSEEDLAMIMEQIGATGGAEDAGVEAAALEAAPAEEGMEIAASASLADNFNAALTKVRAGKSA